jgi:hypothetical protein
MPPAADPQTVALVRSYDTGAAAIRTQVVTFIDTVWAGLGDYRDADIDQFVHLAGPVLDAGQHLTAALTDAYLAALENITLGTATGPAGIPPEAVSTEALRGVPTDELLRRPAVELYTHLAHGEPFNVALERATRRATSVTETNLQLAKTHAAAHVLDTKPNVAGYRRSLKGPASCALCIVASTQRYHRKQLMPIHPGCDCGVITIYADRDPGQVIDPARLAGVQDRIAERFGAFSEEGRTVPGVKLDTGEPATYKDVLVTHTHGEIGPVLGVRGQQFTGPAAIT